MKTVYLLRHAKSSWDDPLVTDHERPLSPRGQEDARRMAAQIGRLRPRPEVVLCSSAARARETFDAVAAGVRRAELRVEDALYGASSDDLLDLLRELPDEVETVLLVGHNPGMQDLAIELAGGGDPASLARLREKFPTGALVRLATDRPWASLGSAQAYLESLVRPRDLTR